VLMTVGLSAGKGPHNTIVGPSGRWVYLGSRNDNYLYVVNSATDQIVRKVGPLVSSVRPFTVNGRETIAYTTATAFLGFQVSSLKTGRVLYTVPIQGFSWNPHTFGPSAPSHGIALSPGGNRLWVMDAPNSHVHLFDVSQVPLVAPRQIADVRLSLPMTGEESPCAYDCARDGWLQLSRDGRYLYVGDSGNVIDTRTLTIVANLGALRNSRKSLEIWWRGGVPVFAGSRSSVGRVAP
jgi:DNA-binding beta-propeller fold protein YncE